MSVVVPFHAEVPHLRAQLETLGQQTYRGWWELMLMDNHAAPSARATADAWAASHDRVRVLTAHDRAGAAYARNVAADLAEGDLLAFCDADDLVSPGWLQALVTAAATADLVGGHLEEGLLNSDAVQSARGSHTDDGLPTLRWMAYTPGGNMAIWRSAFQSLHGFCPNIGPGEDVDLGARAARAGMTLSFAPDAVLHYRLRSSARAIAQQGRAYGRGTMEHRLLDGEQVRLGPNLWSAAKGLVPVLGHGSLHARFLQNVWRLSFRLGGVLGIRDGLPLLPPCPCHEVPLNATADGSPSARPSGS